MSILIETQFPNDNQHHYHHEPGQSEKVNCREMSSYIKRTRSSVILIAVGFTETLILKNFNFFILHDNLKIDSLTLEVIKYFLPT